MAKRGSVGKVSRLGLWLSLTMVQAMHSDANAACMNIEAAKETDSL